MMQCPYLMQVRFYLETIYFFSVQFSLNELSSSHFPTSAIFVKMSFLESLATYIDFEGGGGGGGGRDWELHLHRRCCRRFWPWNNGGNRLIGRQSEEGRRVERIRKGIEQIRSSDLRSRT